MNAVQRGVMNGLIAHDRAKHAMKTNYRQCHSLVALAALLGMACSGCGPSYDRQWDRKSEARVEIESLHRAALVYVIRLGRVPLVTEPGPDRPVEFLAMMSLLSSTNELVYPLIASNAIGRADPWGRTYHVWVDADSNGSVDLPHERLLDRVAIWSVGRNGVNEKGRGDDVRSW